jgi:hypothetical protein
VWELVCSYLSSFIKVTTPKKTAADKLLSSRGENAVQADKCFGIYLVFSYLILGNSPVFIGWTATSQGPSRQQSYRPLLGRLQNKNISDFLKTNFFFTVTGSFKSTRIKQNGALACTVKNG